MSVIMSWSKVKIEVGATGANDAMASSLTELKPIKDKSSNLTQDEGDKLEMKATGGEVVGYEEQEGAFKFTTRVIEPDDTFFTTFGLGTTASNITSMTTHIVTTNMSLKVTPKNVGSKGIEAPKCSVSIKMGYSEEEGHYADLTFGILHGSQNYWYKRFTVQAANAGGGGGNV